MLRMDKMQKWRDRFDRFVDEQNLPEIWSDGLFGYDPERAVEKRAAAWLDFCKIMQQGELEPDLRYLMWALRQACGLPNKRVHGRAPLIHDGDARIAKTSDDYFPNISAHGAEISRRKRANARATNRP